MAYTKIKPIKSERHLQSAVNYVTREDKTDGKTNIYTHMCNTENAVLHFRNVREKQSKKEIMLLIISVCLFRLKMK